MMAEKMVLLCKLTQISLAQEMWPQTKHPLTGVEECQARALFAQSLFEGLLHPPSFVSRPPPLLRDALIPVLGPMLVVSLLSLSRNHQGPFQISSTPRTAHHMCYKCWEPQNLSLCSNRPRHP